MSHTAKVKKEFNRDLRIMRLALAELGWGIRKQDSYRWYGRFMNDYPLPEGVKAEDLGKCEYAIQVPGATYEIGLVATPGGNLAAVWDFWQMGGLSADSGELLATAYAICAAEQAAQEQGWLTERDGEGVLLHIPTSFAGFSGQGGTLRVDKAGIDASGFSGGQCLDAIMALGLPLENVTAKAEYHQAPVAVNQGH